MTRKGIGLKPRITGAHKKWRPISIGMPGEARQFLFVSGHNRDVDARIISSLVAQLQTGVINGTRPWDKYEAIWPIYPGVTPSANNHRWNLKNPQDTDAAYRISWSGSVTHNTTGISSATGGFGNTNFIPSAVNSISATNASLTVYQAVGTVANSISLGVEVNPPSPSIEWATAVNTGAWYPAITSDGVYPLYATPAGGHFVANRLNGTTIQGYNNAALVVDGAAQGSTSVPNIALYLLASNVNGTAGSPSTTPVRYAAAGSGLTANEAADDYAAVQAYQTALGRAL